MFPPEQHLLQKGASWGGGASEGTVCTWRSDALSRSSLGYILLGILHAQISKYMYVCTYGPMYHRPIYHVGLHTLLITSQSSCAVLAAV